MLSIIALVTVPMLLLFLDKIIEYFCPGGVLSTSENEVDIVLNEDDCARIHKIIE
jgi:hypothetical protein